MDNNTLSSVAREAVKVAVRAAVRAYMIRKGGPGKTTFSVHDAFYLHLIKKRRVLFIDLDGQRNGTTTLVKSPYAYLSNVTSNMLFEPAALPKLVMQDGICVISAKDKNFDLIDREDNKPIGHFKKHVNELREYFDEIVIDTPPGVLLRNNATLVVSDFVICPMEVEQRSKEGVADLVQKIKVAKEKFNPGLKLAGMVINRFDKKTTIDKELLGEMIARYGDRVFPTPIRNRPTVYKASIEQSLPIWEVKVTSISSRKDAVEDLYTFFDALEQRIKGGNDE